MIRVAAARFLNLRNASAHRRHLRLLMLMISLDFLLLHLRTVDRILLRDITHAVAVLVVRYAIAVHVVKRMYGCG